MFVAESIILRIIYILSKDYSVKSFIFARKYQTINHKQLIKN